MTTNNLIKTVMTLILFGCLLNVPYGYFQFARLSVFAGCVYLAYNSIADKQNVFSILYIGIAILFQPLFKIHFIRETWNIIDVIIAVIFIIIILISIRQSDS